MLRTASSTWRSDPRSCAVISQKAGKTAASARAAAAARSAASSTAAAASSRMSRRCRVNASATTPSMALDDAATASKSDSAPARSFEL
jgi:hypothetical protein